MAHLLKKKNCFNEHSFDNCKNFCVLCFYSFPKIIILKYQKLFGEFEKPMPKKVFNTYAHAYLYI